MLPVLLWTLETLAQEVGHNGQGLGTRPGAKWLGVGGVLTLRKQGAVPGMSESPTQPPHSQGGRGPYQVGICRKRVVAPAP